VSVIVASFSHSYTAVNMLLGNLKTAMSGTYHAIKFAKYVARCLAEVEYRFNRRYDVRSILGRLARAAVATDPIRESVIRVAEVHR
jgi:ISXO2-like transposase domain